MASTAALIALVALLGVAIYKFSKANRIDD